MSRKLTSEERMRIGYIGILLVWMLGRGGFSKLVKSVGKRIGMNARGLDDGGDGNDVKK